MTIKLTLQQIKEKIADNTTKSFHFEALRILLTRDYPQEVELIELCEKKAQKYYDIVDMI